MKSCILFVFLFTVKCGYALIDPISISVGVGLISLWYNYNTVKDNTYCRFQECCNDDYIPGNINKLEDELKSNLIAQHIVMQQLIPALKAHFSKDVESKKALVLSFHGTAGTGKNYVANFIAKSLYKKGIESKYVHIYKGRADFPLEAQTKAYQNKIMMEVKEAMAECPRSLFIFDEVDKMPAGIFETLTSLVDYNFNRNKADYARAIFVFLSNTAGINISSRLGELMLSGTLREQTKMSDFERILEMGAYNMEGGMQKTSMIEAHVVDHYIPFLPLEKSHVTQCVAAEFKKWGQHATPEIIENIISNAIVFEKKYGLFSTSGCKSVEKKVAVEVKLS